MRAALVRSMNENPLLRRKEITFERFVGETVPMRLAFGDWREITGKQSRREIRWHLIPELGNLRCGHLPVAHLRSLLKKNAEGLGKQSVNHLRLHLKDFIQRAFFQLAGPGVDGIY